MVGKLMFGRSIVVSAMKELVVNLCCIDSSCQTYVHRRCSDKPRRVSLFPCQYFYICRRCLGHNCSVKEK